MEEDERCATKADMVVAKVQHFDTSKHSAECKSSADSSFLFLFLAHGRKLNSFLISQIQALSDAAMEALLKRSG